MKLTPGQIKHIEEIVADKKAANRTLEIALTHHSNTLNAIEKAERQWWEDMALYHCFDLNKNEWSIEKIEGSICIVEYKGND